MGIESKNRGNLVVELISEEIARLMARHTTMSRMPLNEEEEDEFKDLLRVIASLREIRASVEHTFFTML